MPAASMLGIGAVALFISLTSNHGFRSPSPVVEKPKLAETTAPIAKSEPAPANKPATATAAQGNVTTSPGGPKIIVVGDPTRQQQNPLTAHIPERDMLEMSAQGPLPIVAPDGRRPLDVYSRSWSGARGARIAIVIGGLGMSQTGTQQAIKILPGEVTLAFAPEGNSLARWMQTARQNGHELLMQVPFEPFDYPRVNPGRNTLTVDAAPAETLDNLHKTMGRITNYTGIINYMGARFTADTKAMMPVMQDVAKRGLLYLDDGSSARSVADTIATQQGTPFAAADILIDGAQERGSILKKLDELERIARAKGTAIGVGSAFDVTVDAVSAWANEAKTRGIEIVPVSALVRDPEKG
ncbi:divergent polysaccharide deacetylase family protein [Phyllobacterium sp. 628]|nr:divergent polysaccharide deacetylase family protein [Phyllobacterium sp. 628]